MFVIHKQCFFKFKILHNYDESNNVNIEVHTMLEVVLDLIFKIFKLLFGEKTIVFKFFNCTFIDNILIYTL